MYIYWPWHRNNEKDPKFEVDYHLWISKYKSIFGKVDTPRLSDEIVVIKKLKNTVPWIYVIWDFNGEEIVAMIYKKRIAKDKSNRV